MVCTTEKILVLAVKMVKVVQIKSKRKEIKQGNGTD